MIVLSGLLVSCGQGEIEESIEQAMGGTAIETVDLTKERMVKNNMRLLQICVEEYYVYQETSDNYPLSISEIELPNATNPFNTSLNAFVDGKPVEPGQVGYISDGYSYQIMGYGSNCLLDYKISKP